MIHMVVGRAAIACGTTGQGQPVVLLHGSASSGGQWQPLVRLLSGRFRVLTPDLHGHGGSTPWPGPGPLKLADEAAILRACAERVQEPLHVVAHSYGGAVAMHVAAVHPELLRSLTLIEPCAFHLLRMPGCSPDLLDQVDGLAAATARDVAAGDTGAAMARFVDYWNGDGSWAALPAERRAATQRRAAAVAAHFTATLGETTPAATYHAAHVPTLVVYGGQTPAPTRHLADLIARLLPDAELLCLSTAGHMLPITHAHAVNPAIAAHIDAEADRDLRIRVLTWHDRPEIERHLLSLEAVDRRSRFGSTLGDHAISTYARRLDPGRALLFGAVEGRSGRILALAEAQPTAAHRRVELAVSVHSAHRGRGVARRLVGATLVTAFARGADAAELLFSPGNQPMARLVRTLGARITGGATCHAEILRRDFPASSRQLRCPAGSILSSQRPDAIPSLSALAGRQD